MGKKILIISPVPVYPVLGGNRVRLRGLIAALQDMGHEITFIHIHKEVVDQAAMNQLLKYRVHTIPVSKSPEDYPKATVDSVFDDSVWEQVAEIGRRVDPEVVIAEYVFCSRGLESFGEGTLKIIDTHDVFGDRKRIYEPLNMKNVWYSFDKTDEANGLMRADVIVAIQDLEAKYFAKLLPDRRVITTGHLTQLSQTVTQPSYNLLYVGSGAFFNSYSLNWFVDHVFTQIRSRYSDSRLIVVGMVCDHIKDSPGVVKLGCLEFYEEIYAQASIVVNPVLAGTGLKIKNIEALGFSKALITTSIGARGLDKGAGDAFLLADYPHEFVEHISRLFDDSQFRQALCESAFLFAKQWNEAQLLGLQKAISTTRIAPDE